MDATELVRHDLVKAAHDNHETQIQRLAAARGDVATTQQKLDIAWAASREAVTATARGGAKGPVLDLEKAVREAEAHLAFAKRLVEELEAQVAASHAGIKSALGEAYRPVLERGIEARISAAQKAEQARAMLEEAEQQYREGADLVLTARDKGAPLRAALDGASLQRSVPDEKDERNFWEAYR